MQDINKIEPLRIIELYEPTNIPLKIIEKDDVIKIIEKQDPNKIYDLDKYKYNMVSQIKEIFLNNCDDDNVIVGFVGNYKWFHYFLRFHNTKSKY